MAGQLWISWTDQDGNEGSARWGGDRVYDVFIDEVTARAQALMGEPDTIS